MKTVTRIGSPRKISTYAAGEDPGDRGVERQQGAEHDPDHGRADHRDRRHPERRREPDLEDVADDRFGPVGHR